MLPVRSNQREAVAGLNMYIRGPMSLGSALKLFPLCRFTGKTGKTGTGLTPLNQHHLRIVRLRRFAASVRNTQVLAKHWWLAIQVSYGVVFSFYERIHGLRTLLGIPIFPEVGGGST